MRAVTFEEAPANHRDDGGTIGKVIVHDYFGRGHQLGAGPQAYLGRQLEKDSEIHAHFHDVDQFQVVVMGSGRFGRTPVGPITVQYADAYTPYGPLVANEGGMGYFVFRRRAATGGWRMPDHADKIPGRKIGRHFMLQIEDLQSTPAKGEANREHLRTPEHDGLALELLRLGPHASAQSSASDSAGQYLLVCAGSLVAAERKLGPNAVVLPEDGEAAEVRTDTEGAIVLVMSFPAPTDRPGSATGENEGGGYIRAVN